MALVKPSTPMLSILEATDARSGRVNAVIDSPMGSRCKYKYEATTGLFRLSKLLPLGAAFPGNFGFVPSTQGEDGDPLDIVVLMDEPAFPGCVVPVRLIGVLEARQKERNGRTARNDRLIGVLDTEFNQSSLTSIDDMEEQYLNEIEHFFVSYNQVEGRRFEPLGWHGSGRALSLLEAGLQQAA